MPLYVLGKGFSVEGGCEKARVAPRKAADWRLSSLVDAVLFEGEWSLEAFEVMKPWAWRNSLTEAKDKHQF